MTYGEIWNVTIDELNGEVGVHRRVSRGSRRGQSAGVVSSRAGVRRCQACVGAGGLDTKESLLARGDIDSDGESTEKERKEDKGAYLPVGGHDKGEWTKPLRRGKGYKRSRSS